MRLAVANMSLLALESKRTHLFIDRDEQYTVQTGIARNELKSVIFGYKTVSQEYFFCTKS